MVFYTKNITYKLGFSEFIFLAHSYLSVFPLVPVSPCRYTSIPVNIAKKTSLKRRVCRNNGSHTDHLHGLEQGGPPCFLGHGRDGWLAADTPASQPDVFISLAFVFLVWRLHCWCYICCYWLDACDCEVWCLYQLLPFLHFPALWLLKNSNKDSKAF